MSQTTRTLLIVDDSPEDRELYRRYLLRDREYSYSILEAALGKQGLELWQKHQPDAVLLDYRLPDLDGLEFLAKLQSSRQQSCLPIIMVTGYGNEAITVQALKAGAQDYLVKEQITPEGLKLAIQGAIETVQLRTQLQQRIERERVVAQITRKIHQTLDLAEILQTTVTEVRQFLGSDRVFIYRFQPDFSGIVVVESVVNNCLPILNVQVEDEYFQETHGEDYRQGRIQAVADIYTAGLNECHVDLLAQLQIRANLVVPILHEEALWGLLVANQCSAPREWQPLEIDLLQQLTTQVGIALQQAELYQQAQNELTERKQAQIERDRLLEREQAARAEAERANRVKDEFLAILSHELRSPLNSILGWAQLLQRRKFDVATTDEALASIERNAKLQTQLIDDLLDIAKILRGKLTMNIAPVNLVFVIQSAINTVSTAAIAKSIVLHPVLSQIGQVFGDATRLQQVVWNLLSNAIKFTPNNGRIDIRLEQVGNSAQITVSDTGKGINPDFLPYIFESFRQEDVSTTRQYGGLGLGLAIVRSLVEAHGGTICAQSKGEGRGATFTVQLPLLNAEPQRNQPDKLPKQEPELTGIRVLVVDDELDTRELFTALLTQYGAEVLTVASAAETLASLESFQPDVLVSDIGMPEMDGYALLQQVRSLPPSKGGQIPAIALSAYARVEDQQRSLDSGFQHHISKPINCQELLQAISDLAGH